MKQHPLSAAFPSMPESEFRELILDIEKNGLRHPIVTFGGQVIDGWHRFRACQECGVKPRFQELGPVDPVAYVISANMHRRHLTGSQRAAAVVACSAWAPIGHNQHTGGSEAASAPHTEAEMAEAAGVSDRTIRQAKRAHEAGLTDAVKEGKVTVEKAAAIAKLPEEERAAALEAPAAKPEPKAKACECEALRARNSELEAELEELRGINRELIAAMEGLQADWETAKRALDAEDLLGRFEAEVSQAQAMTRVTQAQNRTMQGEIADLTNRLKSAQRRIKTLEKSEKGKEAA